MLDGPEPSRDDRGDPDRVAHHREKRGWSQGDLAQRLDIGQSSVSRFETGQSQPDAFTFGRLAQAFGMSVGQLAAQVDRAVEQARNTATRSSPAAAGVPWWQVALGVAGAVGLAAIATFAVAAALQDDEDEE